MMLLSMLLAANALSGPIQDVDGDWDWEEPVLIPWEIAEGPHSIVNGTETNEHPAVVAIAIEMGSFMSVMCSGTLIHPEWVVTAAHCVDSAASQQLNYGTAVVVFGKNAANGGQFTVEMDDWFPHPGWTGDLQVGNDIGLVHLSRPVDEFDVMIVNDEVPDETWLGTKLTFVGYGVTSDSQQGSGTKRKTKIPLLDFTDQFLSSYDPDTNVCNGDSGGAALEETEEGLFELAGVNSYVTPSCNGGANGASNVASFLPFLDRHVVDVLYEAPPALVAGGGVNGLGIAEPVPGIGPRWSERVGPGTVGGCSQSSGAPSAMWWTALLLIAARRRR